MTNVQIENGKKRYQFAELERGDFFYHKGDLCMKVKQKEIGSVATYAVSINEGTFIEIESNDEVMPLNSVTLVVK